MFNFYPVLLNKFDTNTLMPTKDDDVTDNGQIKESSFTFMDDLFSNVADLGASAFDWGIKLITILFIIGVIVMIMAMIFKHGQWQKYAQTTMLWSFISMMILRGAPIIFLSFRSKADVDTAFSTALGTLSEVAIFVGMMGIGISLLFKFGYMLIEHPEYYKWYKNARNISAIMILFAFIGPIIFSLL